VIRVSSVWLSADPGVVFVLLVAWGWAALRAGALLLAATPRELGGRIRTVLILTTAGLVLAATRTVLIAMLPPAGWWFVQEKVVLALPLLLVPALAVVALSVPRLITLGRAVRAFNGVAAMPPSLRHAAAHPPCRRPPAGALARPGDRVPSLRLAYALGWLRRASR
jgi:hypothetical protein